MPLFDLLFEQLHDYRLDTGIRAYHRWVGPKEMTVYAFNKHEDGGVALTSSRSVG